MENRTKEAQASATQAYTMQHNTLRGLLLLHGGASGGIRGLPYSLRLRTFGGKPASNRGLYSERPGQPSELLAWPPWDIPGQAVT